MSLATRTFAVSAVAIILSLGIALAVSWFVGERIARQAAAKALEGTRAAQEHYQRLQLRELQLISGLLAADPYFSSYVAEATLGGIGGDQAVDRSSISDLLRDRESEFGFALAMVLDDAGELIVRTDRPSTRQGDRLTSPLVDRVVDDLLPAAGLWSERDRLYQVAVVPLARDDLLTGFLVTGLEIGDELAAEVKRAGGAELIFLINQQDQWSALASTMDVAVSERVETALRGILEGPARSAGGFDISVDDSDWLAQITPLTDVDGTVLGAAVSLGSLDAQLAPFRSIQRWLLAAAGVGLLLALLASLLMARRAAKPVQNLVLAAEAAADGDYQVTLDPGGGDEIGRLSDSIDRLLSRLREKQDMEDYVQDVSRFLPDPATETPTRNQTVSKPARLDALDLLAIRLPEYSGKLSEDDAGKLAREYKQAVAKVNAALGDQGGEVIQSSGALLVVAFEDAGQSLAAIHGSAAIFSLWPNCAQAMVSGAGLRVSFSSHQAVIGNILMKLLRLLGEASSGQLMLAPDVVKARAQHLEGSKLVPVVERGKVSHKGFYALRHTALRVLGAQAPGSRPALVGRRSESLAVGDWLGKRYQILSMLGRGGMGEVYKARDEELDDVVALKILRPDLLADPKPLERLKEELKIARRIAHTNVLRTYDFGEQDGIAYISMEYVRGFTLRYLLKQRSRLPYSAGLRIARQLCDGLAVAHEDGIVHRDIKPENLIIEQSGNLKLMDFGIARPVRREVQGLTQPGSFIGTPHYVAPEVMQGVQPDHRADLYSVGIVFNEMFTGELPFSGNNTMEISIAHIQDPPKAPSDSWEAIPPPLEQIILRCLAKQPADRFQTAMDIRHALDALRG